MNRGMLPLCVHTFTTTVVLYPNQMRLILLSSIIACIFLQTALGTCIAQSSAPREWNDSTGNFKVKATLDEVKEGFVYLTTTDGRSLKIPVKRLSQADQEFVKDGENPFKEVVPEEGNRPQSKTASEQPSKSKDSDFWDEELAIRWDDVEELDRSFDTEWKVELPQQSELGFSPKRVSLNKKNNFHEDIRRLEINPSAQRAVAGYTVSFSVPKPQSRLALIDLVSGKAIHTVSVEANMTPLCLLNDGGTALMNGASDERGGFETPDQVQLWKLAAKKITRSMTWVPFPDEAEFFGKKTNAHVIDAIPLPNNKLILVGNNGHVACIDASTRKAFWHSRLSQNFSVDASLDRSLLAILDGQMVMIVDPQKGKVLCAQSLDEKPHVAWPKIRWSPSGKRLLVSFTSELRVLDLVSGQWIHKYVSSQGALAPNALSYPHDDFALLENRLLVHIPSQIKVCEYRNATRINTLGGTTFAAIQGNDAGAILPVKLPHPAAEKILAQAEKDPSVFLIHPGVEVSIDAKDAGEHAAVVAKSLEAAAVKAGYRVAPSSPISLVASIAGPKQEAVSYIASGAYIANVFQSNIKLTWQDKVLWSTGGNNIPAFLQTARGESIQDKLNELGKKPNLAVFENAQFPKLLQKPTSGPSNSGATEALMATGFSMQGLENL